MTRPGAPTTVWEKLTALAFATVATGLAYVRFLLSLPGHLWRALRSGPKG